MEEEIVDKLKKTLIKCIENESDVVYLMVGIRKVLEMKGVSGFLLLKFYCDWILHHKKDLITKEIKQIMNKIDSSIPKDKSLYPAISIKDRTNIDFIYMKELKKQLDKFLKKYDLPLKLVTDKKCWITFVKLLTKILENQPIINPSENIKSFSFIPAKEGVAIWVIEFNDEREKCRFGNFF